MASPNRKKNYQDLLDVGYTPKEARKYRDFSKERIEQLIADKTFKVGDVVYTRYISNVDHGKITEVKGDILVVKLLVHDVIVNIELNKKYFKKVEQNG